MKSLETPSPGALARSVSVQEASAGKSLTGSGDENTAVSGADDHATAPAAAGSRCTRRRMTTTASPARSAAARRPTTIPRSTPPKPREDVASAPSEPDSDTLGSRAPAVSLGDGDGDGEGGGADGIPAVGAVTAGLSTGVESDELDPELARDPVERLGVDDPDPEELPPPEAGASVSPPVEGDDSEGVVEGVSVVGSGSTAGSLGGVDPVPPSGCVAPLSPPVPRSIGPGISIDRTADPAAGAALADTEGARISASITAAPRAIPDLRAPLKATWRERPVLEVEDTGILENAGRLTQPPTARLSRDPGGCRQG